MKTGVFFAVFSILALSIFLVWSRFEDFNHNISISVSEERETLTNFRPIMIEPIPAGFKLILMTALNPIKWLNRKTIMLMPALHCLIIRGFI
jgi:hypothetical protein